MTTRFILVRHGQTEWNRGAERFRGRADLLLNDTGLEQANKIGARLAQEKIAAVYASPLKRTMQTAQPIAAVHQLQVVEHSGLLDLDFGALEGMTVDEARLAFPDVIEKWLTAPGHAKFPKGGSLKAVRGRIDNLFNDLVPRHAGETVVLVSHKVVCGAMLCYVLDLSADALWRIQQDNGCINAFEKHGDNWIVTLMNDTSHLGIAN
jgi:broad specificity phosphatase PhoE